MMLQDNISDNQIVTLDATMLHDSTFNLSCAREKVRKVKFLINLLANHAFIYYFCHR